MAAVVLAGVIKAWRRAKRPQAPPRVRSEAASLLNLEEISGFQTCCLLGRAGSEGHHLRAAEDRLRRGVRAQQQRQHREAQVHVHPRLQEAGIHREWGPFWVAALTARHESA